MCMNRKSSAKCSERHSGVNTTQDPPPYHALIPVAIRSAESLAAACARHQVDYHRHLFTHCRADPQHAAHFGFSCEIAAKEARMPSRQLDPEVAEGSEQFLSASQVNLANGRVHVAD